MQEKAPAVNSLMALNEVSNPIQYPLYGFWMITENKSNLHKSLKLVAKNLQFQVLILEEKFCPLKKIYLPTCRATYLTRKSGTRC